MPEKRPNSKNPRNRPKLNGGFRQISSGANFNFWRVDMDQLQLFTELPDGCRARQVRRGACAKSKKKPIKAVQLAFDLTFYVDPDSDPWSDAPIIHRLISAKDAKPIAVSAPISVFAMGLVQLAQVKMQPAGKAAITRVVRTDGVVKCIRIIEQETDEWKVREAARRAKQIVPKPPKSAKTFSKKFQDLIGK